MSDLPPCIVLGLESQIGLGIVRELGRHGVPVIGIARSRSDIGLSSRYLREAIVTDAPRGVELAELIRGIGERHEGVCLMAVSEGDLLWMAQCRDTLLPVKVIVPPLACLERVFDKSRTLGLARSLGLAVPETLQPLSLEEALTAGRTLGFPVVLKWSEPSEVAELLARHGLGLVKAEYARDQAELSDIVRRYAPLGRWPLIQRYAPGAGLGQFFFVHEGVVVRRFQHTRIAEWPPEGGFSSVCDAVPLSRHASLQSQSVALLRALEWEGVAMVEYRYDAATDSAVLMEVNGRFWGSFPLAVACEAGFAYLAYAAHATGRIPRLPPPRDDLRCRMVITEVKRLLRIVFRRNLIRDPYFIAKPTAELLRFAADFLRPRVRYFVWSLDDPRPFLADLANGIRRLTAARRARPEKA